MARTEFFGIRHHGPGSARSLRRELTEFRPDVVLIEGPPEADSIIELAGEPAMVPPVALLAYVPPAGTAAERATRRSGPAAFWPFAEFSPEWQAIRYALAAGVAVRFCDLPAAHQLADPDDRGDTDDRADPGEPDSGEPGEPGEPDSGEPGEPDSAADGSAAQGTAPGENGADEDRSDEGRSDADHSDEGELIRSDPIGRLAAAAGHDDPERWWDDVIEHRGEGPAAFPAIAEAMAALREHAPPLPEAEAHRERRREAYMRRTLRRALKDGFERIAVVCGAWHVPAIAAALATTPFAAKPITAAADDRVLRGLPKAKVAMTWVPWTHGRLAGWSGYGAGVQSPGWYHHLFTAPDRPIERWLTGAARVLRDEGLHVSSAHVIEAVRLAETLATLRDRPLAGLAEVTEAARAVLCEGADLPLELIQRQMVVGERLGSVPDGTPMVPVQRDLHAEQRRLRLKPSALDRPLDLDLRKPLDLDRSRLLHRLRLLGIDWGTPDDGDHRAKGTFRETWSLRWQPELDVDLIEAGTWGTTVAGAAAAKAVALAAAAPALTDLTSVAERCLLADLEPALPRVMRELADRAAVDTDVAHLMAALPALVRVLRYGDVRGTATGALRSVVDGLIVRICAGLPAAVSRLDDDAARVMLKNIDAVHGALTLLEPPADSGPGPHGHLGRWLAMLGGLLERSDLHGLLDGRLSRLLYDADRLPDVRLRMARAVSVGQSPVRAAGWVEGFLTGGGLVLVHDEHLLRLLDDWLAGLPADSFTDVLPLLRRTFGTYEEGQRRLIGDRVRDPGRRDRARAPDAEDDLNLTRSAAAEHTVAAILALR